MRCLTFFLFTQNLAQIIAKWKYYCHFLKTTLKIKLRICSVFPKVFFFCFRRPSSCFPVNYELICRRQREETQSESISKQKIKTSSTRKASIKSDEEEGKKNQVLNYRAPASWLINYRIRTNINTRDDAIAFGNYIIADWLLVEESRRSKRKTKILCVCCV